MLKILNIFNKIYKSYKFEKNHLDLIFILKITFIFMVSLYALQFQILKFKTKTKSKFIKNFFFITTFILISII